MKKLFAILLSFQLIISPMAFAGDPVDAYTATGNASDAGGSQFINSLMMTGSGVVGSTLIMCTPASYTFSHYIFAAGALVLLVGEIIAATKQKENLKESEKQLARSTLVAETPLEDLTQEQKDLHLKALQLAKEEEQKNRDALDQRIQWLGAAEIVYWLAVAGAAVETVLYALTKVPVTAYIGYTDWSLTCNNEGQNKLVTLGVSAAYGVIGALNTPNADAMSVIMKGAMTTMGSMMLLNFMVDSVNSTLGKVVNSAPGRIIIFGVFAALAEVTRGGFQDRIRQADKNLEAIQKAIDAWTAATVGGPEIIPGPIPESAPTITGGAGAGAGAGPQPPKPLIKPLTPLPKLGKCMGSSLVPSEKSCLTPLKFNRASIKFKSKFLNSTANKVFDMSEAMARDDAAAADSMAGAMGSSAARVKAEALGLIAEMNAGRVKNGEKPIDFDKEVKAQLASLRNAAVPGGMNGGDGASGSLATLDGDVKKSDSASTAGAPAVAAPVTVALPKPDLALPVAEELPANGAVAEVPPSVDNFETPVDDVASKDDVSIFKQLTPRYFLNYSEVFDRKKQEDIVPPNAPKKMK